MRGRLVAMQQAKVRSVSRGNSSVGWFSLLVLAAACSDSGNPNQAQPFLQGRAGASGDVSPATGGTDAAPESEGDTNTPGSEQSIPDQVDPGNEEQPGGSNDGQPQDPPAVVDEGPLGDGFAIVEALDRGVVAVVQEGGVYVGWRMFGYEYDRESPERVAYRVFRDGAAIADVSDSTNFFDGEGSGQSNYQVALLSDGEQGELSPAVQPWAQQFIEIPLEPPGAGYNAHDTSVGDADGDGQYELFMLWQPNNAQDNSNGGVTDDVFIDALRLDGTRLWRINLGPNIRAGEHYTQFVVIDADGDGSAELGLRTAPGTRDGLGNFLSKGPAADDDDSEVYRNQNGYVLNGPEYFTVFSGLTGEELATAQYHVPRGNVGSWGDNYGNRVDRFLATAAYLDDTGLPSIVMARGYYTRTTLGAWNYRNGELTQLWVFDSDASPVDAQGRRFTGQGAHSLSVANVDADPQQEIIYGAMTVDHNGVGLCSTNMDHGDALHASDFLPERPGIEVFMPTEVQDRPHWTVRDGATCEILQQSNDSGADVGRGVAADVVAGNAGAEFWASSGVRLSSMQNGQEVGGPQPNSVNFLIWWDADELRELENGTAINKVGAGQLLNCGACSSNNGSKSVPSLVADVLGDWREEVIWRLQDNSALRLYTTTDVTERRIYTLMHDPQYRAAISWQNVAYNQPPHPGFFLGDGMEAPPVPDIRVQRR